MIITLGIDPGDTAGFLLAGWRPGERRAAFARAFQCDGASAAHLLGAITGWEAETGSRVNAAGLEGFIESRKGLKGTSPAAIRAQVAELENVLAMAGIPCYTRPAARVETWATLGGDERLKRAGLLAVCAPAAMKHAKSAAWHCLYCAVHDCGLPDPLSRQRARESGNVP